MDKRSEGSQMGDNSSDIYRQSFTYQNLQTLQPLAAPGAHSKHPDSSSTPEPAFPSPPSQLHHHPKHRHKSSRNWGCDITEKAGHDLGLVGSEEAQSQEGLQCVEKMKVVEW